MKSRHMIAALMGAGLIVGATSALTSTEVTAADHAEAPNTQANRTADILDFYAWHNDTQLIAIITYSSFIEAGGPPEYDPDVLYVINIDNNGDFMPDEEIEVRFGQNMAGDWGVQFDGIPGVPTVSGPVATPITTEGPGGEMVWAGLADDPFFFDLDGYLATLDTGIISFDPMNDTFAGFNGMAIVLQAPLDAVAAGSNEIDVWASTYAK